MGINERKQKKAEALKAEIIEASWAIVQKEGWENLSIRKIADAIEYSVPVVYRYFESKERIIAHFVLQGFELLKQHIEDRLQEQSGDREKLLALTTAYWEFAVKNTALYQIMFAVGIPSCPAVRNNSSLSEISGCMQRLIMNIIPSQKRSSVDIDLKVKTLWSILHGIISMDLLSIDEQCKICPSLVLRDAIQGYVSSLTIVE